MRRPAISLAIAALVVSSGCGPLPWGSGGLGEELAAEAIDPQGLVFVLDSEDLAAASTKLTAAVADRWADGVPLAGGTLLTEQGGEQLRVEWGDVRLEPGLVKLSLDTAGLRVAIGVRAGPSELAVSDALAPLCVPTVTIDGVLTLGVALGSDKAGRVQASLIDTPEPWAGELSLDWGECGEILGAPPRDVWADALWAALAEDASAPLGADILAALPRALGLEVSLGVATTIAADELGAGLARVSVEAHDLSADTVARVVGGRLVVPLSVGIDAEAHPCIADASLPAVTPRPPPLSDDDADDGLGGATLVSGTILRRAVAALWLSGAVCGDHATAGQSLRLADLGVAWGPLRALPPETPLELSLWPRELPDVALDAASGATLLVSTGLMDVEVYGEVDGASVRLLSLSVDADVSLALSVTSDGLLTGAVSDVVLRASGPRAGLVAAPDAQTAEAIVSPLVTTLFAGRPLLRLPPRARAGTRRATATGGYLIIPRG